MHFLFFLIIILLFDFMVQVGLPNDGREKGESPLELVVEEALELITYTL